MKYTDAMQYMSTVLLCECTVPISFSTMLVALTNNNHNFVKSNLGNLQRAKMNVKKLKFELKLWNSILYINI